MQKHWYENEKRSECINEVNSGPTGCTGTQEAGSDGAEVVCGDNIARERSNVSLPAQRILGSMAIKQQEGQKGPDSFMGSSRVTDTAKCTGA